MGNQPNVLLICTDHWPGKLLGVAGHPCIQTPTLDQLARDGVRYNRAYSEVPVCIAARRTLMTGCSARTHGDRQFDEWGPMPGLPTMGQTFRDAGYQATAVGKLHVYPTRNRIGFDEVILGEEGRAHFGVVDDFELFLGDRGYAGRQFHHGMGNNEYLSRPWHLPEDCHVTNWATDQMARTITRRDPTRPAFWYLSYCHPHPPMVPLQCYLDIYQSMRVDMPTMGAWADDPAQVPYGARLSRSKGELFTDYQIRSARQAFYALCTHIDHQLRIVIGTLREQGILDDTIILFTADHGDMLGKHGMWAKRVLYEESAQVPMILSAPPRVGRNLVDDRLVGWQDVMPTLLSLTGIDIPSSVEGRCMVSGERRSHLYGECGIDATATRMLHDGRFKLIYYSAGNRSQLFDLEEDPEELTDLWESEKHYEVGLRLQKLLIAELYGSDETWVRDGALQGLPESEFQPMINRGLSAQRGTHWPPPPRQTL